MGVAAIPTMLGVGLQVVPAGAGAAQTQPVSISSGRQYELTASDGTTWQPMDPVNLSFVAPANTPQDTRVTVTVTSDLWTAVAGYNQDIGIAQVSSPGATPVAPIAWHESGGAVATFSPNATTVEIATTVGGNNLNTLEVVWKANVANGAGGRPTPSMIYAGAGSAGNFSPTTLAVQYTPSALPADSTSQHQLTASQNPTQWQPVDQYLNLQITPGVSETWSLAGNADMWTTALGINQDLGILVSPACTGDASPTTLVWKESGGSAGTYSPDAVYVQDACAMSVGTSYTVTLEWRSNLPIPAGQSIDIGAGPDGVTWSDTYLTATAVSPSSAQAFQQQVITSQPKLTGSDGVTWQPVSPTLSLAVGGANGCAVYLGGNADLWTADSGDNQDLGLQVTPPTGPTYILAWKESGGFATYSPDAAFVQGVLQTTSATSYTVTLVWKANKSMRSGDTIYMGAGAAAPFSPTTLDAQTTC